MKRFVILVISLVLMMSISFAGTYTSDVQIQSNRLVSCKIDKMVGTFEIKNNSDIYNSDIYYIVSLNILRPSIAGEEVTKYFKFYEYEPVRVEVGAKETKNITYEYKIPTDIPRGKYAISVQLYSKTMPIGYESYIAECTFGTREGYLDRAGFEHWEIDEIKYGTLDGPNVTEDTLPVGIIELKSNFEEDKILTPQFTVYKRNQSYEGKPVEIIYKDDRLFEAGEKTKLELAFPLLEEPESYLIHLVFLDEEGKQVSSIYEFRYVLVGASAKILSMNSRYDELNDKIDIDINVIGPADSSDLEDAEISYKIYNSVDNSLILQKSITETLTKEVMTIDESIEAENITGDFDVVVEIRYENNILASMENKINISKVKLQEEIFSDLIGTKYLNAVKVLNGLNILNGYPDGTFKPANPITRAEFTVIATKLAELDVADIQSAELKFNDISNEHWAKNFIILAYENSIISGYPDGTFKPDNNVTYQEALTILLNVMGYKWEVTKLNLDWPQGYIQMANTLNMMQDVGEVDYVTPANRGDVALLTLVAYLSLAK